MTEQTVTLQPGESKPVSFEAIPHEAKTYQVSVDGLTGSFRAVAVAVALPFTFSNVSAFRTSFTDAPSWATIVFSCTITNPGYSGTVRAVKLWRRYKYRDGQERTALYRTLDIFIAARSSINFVWDGNTYDVENRKFNGPLIPSGGSVCMWLDDSGNLSQEGCA